MPVIINDLILSTEIFIAIFVLVLLLTLRRKKDSELFPLALTQELKGLAILAVVFSHIGYFLSADHRFLFPLSIMAGAGVNLFLFLSGYGLMISALKKRLSAGEFYKKRLLKLFTPFWIVIIIFFLFDFFFLRIPYSWPYIIQSLLGFFPRADIFLDIDSPLWFFTPVLFYYLIFPLAFFSKRPWLTAIFIYTASYLALQFKLPVSIDVLHLYQLHLLAFPLGVALASLFFKPVWIKTILEKFKTINIFQRSPKIFNRLAYYVISIALLILIGYLAYNSGVGESQDKEQAISLATMGAIIFFFMMKKLEIKLLYIFGLYAYEIYLIHWPLMSRYDLFFKWFPGWLALVLYLGIFLIFAWALNKFSNQIRRIKTLR